ncbi:MAG: sodium-dependent bicarbonate transport family permease [Myxococcota bacterium]|nr:sodium-dependent bicarbonate transport family permease [Myxococcota bacterium]
MDPGFVLDNLISAPVLFFALGVFACLVGSDLEVPQPVAKLLSLYLLLSIGLKGGVELRVAGLSPDVVAGLGAGVSLAFAVPVWTFFLLRKRLGVEDAAGVAATYGSISAVTFIVAVSFLDGLGEPYGGHMVAAMALMESPAIIMGLLLAQRFARSDTTTPRPAPLTWGSLLHEAAFNPAVLLLCGSMLIGVLIGPAGFDDVAPFVSKPFKGILCLFLLEMGLLATRRLGDLRRAGSSTIAFGLVAPPAHAALAIALGQALGLEAGDTLLLAALSGSASYIAVPAALRLSLPEANPSLYVPLSLGITFPFNVIIGIPVYWWVIGVLHPAGG